jgi:hypothetical protein
MAINVQSLDRLKAQLLTSGIQEKNQALYQVINLLIDTVRQGFSETNAAVFTPSGGGIPGGIINQSFYTQNNDTGVLPNSRQLVAGINIEFTASGIQVLIDQRIHPFLLMGG